MHGRLRGPISQLPLPPAKGFLLPVLPLDYGAEKMIMEKGRNDIVKRPSAQILTVVSTPTSRGLTFTTPTKDDPFITNTKESELSEQRNQHWLESNSFFQVLPHTLPLWWEVRWAGRKMRKPIQQGLGRTQSQGLTNSKQVMKGAEERESGVKSTTSMEKLSVLTTVASKDRPKEILATFKWQWTIRSTISVGKVKWKWQSLKLKELNQYEIWMLTYGLTGVGEKQRLG